MSDEPAERRRDRYTGVWVAYYTDHSATVVFGDEIEALREGVRRQMNVAWWWYGNEWGDWESAT